MFVYEVTYFYMLVPLLVCARCVVSVYVTDQVLVSTHEQPKEVNKWSPKLTLVVPYRALETTAKQTPHITSHISMYIFIRL